MDLRPAGFSGVAAADAIKCCPLTARKSNSQLHRAPRDAQQQPLAVSRVRWAKKRVRRSTITRRPQYQKEFIAPMVSQDVLRTLASPQDYFSSCSSPAAVPNGKMSPPRAAEVLNCHS